MISAGVAGRYRTRPSRLGPLPRYQRPPATRTGGFPLAAIGVSFAGHLLLVLAFVAMVLWGGWHSSKVYVVNLVPAVAAIGHPRAPAPRPSMPARPAPVLPSRAPAPAPTPAPRERAVREAPRLPEPALPRPGLPPRQAIARAGEKELPPMAAPRPTARAEKPEKVDRAVESRAAPPAARGLPTGSPVGVGPQTLDVSDFPYAWYLRQVLQKVQTEWQRQNQISEPDQKPSVFVEIQRDGSIRTPRIHQSSGNTLYDQAALRAIVEASPFPPLPQEWPKPSLRVEFRFDLERS